MRLCDFLIAGPAYFGRFDAALRRVMVLHHGCGPYYGMTWSEDEIYVLARNGGKGELILVFDPAFAPRRILEVRRNIDGHQIHFRDGELYVTATRENALIRVDPRSGRQVIWNWTGHSTDINHINGIGEGPAGHFWVSHDNRKGTPSEIVQLSVNTGMIVKRILIDGPMNGTHNIESGVVSSSGDDSFIWDIANNDVPLKVFAMRNAFFRGLGRMSDDNNGGHFLIGASPVLTRQERGLPHECMVHLVSRARWDHAGAVVMPRIGQIHDLRSLAPGCSHNGVAFPGENTSRQSLEDIPADFRGPDRFGGMWQPLQ